MGKSSATDIRPTSSLDDDAPHTIHFESLQAVCFAIDIRRVMRYKGAMSYKTSVKGISAGQCRAARGLLNWSQGDLAKKSRVSRAAIAAIEGGTRESYDRTMYDIIRAFQDAGIEFSTVLGDGDDRGDSVTYWYQREGYTTYGFTPPPPKDREGR
jgi:transcriptional regulator with XRE-family HTH domain